MAYVITEPCVGVKDGTCVDVCPVDCIAGTQEDPQLYIDPELCVDCDLCAEICPVEAILPEDAVPPEQRHYVEINRRYFEGSPL